MTTTIRPSGPVSDNSKKRETVAGYLSRLGIRSRPAPTVAALAELQRRHLDAVPYENLAIMLGRPDSTDPSQTLARIAAGGNAGYCFHHNGAFELVLRDLGFAVQRRFGQVWNKPEERAIPELNHLVLLVTIGGRRWWPDLGLGDALRDPVEVTDGEIRQGPFRYEIRDAGADGWTFRHDPAAGSFGNLDVRQGSPAPGDVARSHLMLSTPPDGRFTRVLVVQRREDTGTGVLRGIRLQRVGEQPFTRDLTAFDDWRAALESMRVSLAGVTGDELRALHGRMLAAHEERAAADKH
jgi:N-hydroxyarylamine O-acetyltransferase